MKFPKGRVAKASSRQLATVRNVDTKSEIKLRAILDNADIKYETYRKDLPGNPDIILTPNKVAIFCDGDFWHGRNWPERRARGEFQVRAKYWVAKIEGNMARDKRVSSALRKQGWSVLRIWESDIAKREQWVLGRIIKAASKQKNKGAIHPVKKVAF